MTGDLISKCPPYIQRFGNTQEFNIRSEGGTSRCQAFGACPAVTACDTSSPRQPASPVLSLPLPMLHISEFTIYDSHARWRMN